MRIITGDETGLLKSTSLEAQRIVVAGTQTRERAIKALCWLGPAQTYAAARQDGVVTVWEDGDKVRACMRVCAPVHVPPHCMYVPQGRCACCCVSGAELMFPDAHAAATHPTPPSYIHRSCRGW